MSIFTRHPTGEKRTLSTADLAEASRRHDEADDKPESMEDERPEPMEDEVQTRSASPDRRADVQTPSVSRDGRAEAQTRPASREGRARTDSQDSRAEVIEPEDVKAAPVEAEPVEAEVIEDRPAGPSEGEHSADQLEPLFAQDIAADYRHRWSQIQSDFVDDPRRAVRSGDELVAQVMSNLASSFAQERRRVESQLDQSGEAATENLRVALRRYRSFFERLLEL